jgi:hypothetical protein
VTTVTVWHGPDEALQALAAAVANNCVCDPTIPHVCASHRMLSDQRILDHLAFVAANVKGYLQAEFDPVGEWL